MQAVRFHATLVRQDVCDAAPPHVKARDTSMTGSHMRPRECSPQPAVYHATAPTTASKTRQPPTPSSTGSVGTPSARSPLTSRKSF